MMSAADALVLVVGTLLGILFFLVAGLGKLMPAHPMYQVLGATFERAIGPFFGLSATMTTVLRMVIGAAELAAGLVFLGVFWGEALGLVPGKAAPCADALLLCAIIGMINIMTGALIFNLVVEQQIKKVVPYFVFIFLLSMLLSEQLEAGSLASLSENWIRLIYGFLCICGLGLVLSLAFAAKYGAGASNIQKQMQDIERMREQLLSK